MLTAMDSTSRPHGSTQFHFRHDAFNYHCSEGHGINWVQFMAQGIRNERVNLTSGHPLSAAVAQDNTGATT